MSEFVEVKVSELIGPALDYAVGIAEGNPMRVPVSDVVWSDYHGSYAPSINWAQGGPLWDEWATSMEHYDGWLVAVAGGDAAGPTKLIALCRAIVSAKFGDAVQVPAELVEWL